MEIQTIQSKIYTIRGVKVMLDRDLAEMYGVESRVLKQSVRRNIERFEGDDFMFELTKQEYNSLRSQIVILKRGRGEHSKYLHYAFTELGVAMLSSVLNSKTAIEINRSVMRAFVTIRQTLSCSSVDGIVGLQQELKELKNYVEELFTDQNDINEDTRMQLDLINQTLAEMQVNNKHLNSPRRRIGFIKEE